MVEILITFNTTTATLKGQKILSLRKGELDSEIEQDVIAVPYVLSETCYGLGLAIKVENMDTVKQIFKIFKEEEIDFKRFWELCVGTYTDITNKFE